MRETGNRCKEISGIAGLRYRGQWEREAIECRVTENRGH